MLAGPPREPDQLHLYIMSDTNTIARHKLAGRPTLSRVAGGISPPGSHGTGREPLSSSGSCRSAGSGRKVPMSEEPGRALASSVPPSPCAFWISLQSFELPHRPSNQMLVDAPCDEMQPGAIEGSGRGRD